MTAPRIKSLTLKGFRAFGSAEQTLNLSSGIAATWGPNSKGKTSLAESFEFLLTGRITRRELMASSQDEFADALRNAHLPEGEEVYVSASITAPDGSDHEVKRTLTQDYAKRQGCASRLEIDGAEASEADLLPLGITLSQPPLEAPVLAQHTLSYIFSVRPQDRANYFKTLLEVSDLDNLRNDIAALADDLQPPNDPLLTKIDTCAAIDPLKPVLSGILSSVPDHATLESKIAEAAAALIDSVQEDVPDGLDARLKAIEKILADRRSKTFPVKAFERKQLAGWNPPTADLWSILETYIEERKKVDDETRRLVNLFTEALNLPAVSEITNPINCPLCGTDSALIPARVQVIRQNVEETQNFKAAETAAKTALNTLSSSVDNLLTAVEAALPSYLQMTAAQRREAGFTIARIRELLDDQAEDLLTPWLHQARLMARTGAALRRAANAARAAVHDQASDIATKLSPETLRTRFDALTSHHTRLADTLTAYAPTAQALGDALNRVLDEQADTSGWQDFVDIAREPEKLRTFLIERQARATVAKELNTALKQIDRAKENVLDDKFAEHSELIQAWWERLRPDEPTFFSAVKPRKGAKRTIDFKAGLSPHPDKSSPKMRDVIAIFSQSQLHCLGLALFLARSQHEKLGFIILDDPVLSGDKDYRVHFNTTVLTALLDLPIQAVVLTQDHATWEELETRYSHRGISTAQLYIDQPVEGTIIENTSDTLRAKINRAKTLAPNGHPDGRKECGVQLRDAAELFCKQLLVGRDRQNGYSQTSLTDYDGKTLEWLCPRVTPLLSNDPSHGGKLDAFKKIVNDACHDNDPPEAAEMCHACSEIKHLADTYLPRGASGFST